VNRPNSSRYEGLNDCTNLSNIIDIVNSLTEIADRQIKMWKTRTIPFPEDKNPLDEWPGRHGAVHLFPWLGVLARRVLAIPAPVTSDLVTNGFCHEHVLFLK